MTYKTILVYVLLFFSILSMSSRIHSIYASGFNFGDFIGFYDSAHKLAEGGVDFNVVPDEPQKHANYVYPPTATLLTPYLIFSSHTAGLVHLGINVIMLIMIMNLLINRFAGDMDIKERILFTFLFLSSTPVGVNLAVGQLSIFVILVILLSLEVKNSWLSGILLGFGLVMKYSFLPFASLIFIRKDHLKVLAVAGILFCTMFISPMLYVHSLTELYQNYYKNLSVGIDQYESFLMDGAYDRIDLNFFLNPYFNFAVLGLVFGFILYLMKKYRGVNDIGLEAFLLWTCLAYSLVYHRQDDLILTIPLLLIYFRQTTSVISFLFLLFFTVPSRIVISLISTPLYTVFQNNSLIAMGARHVVTPKIVLFPTYAVAHLLLMIFAFVIYFSSSRRTTDTASVSAITGKESNTSL